MLASTVVVMHNCYLLLILLCNCDYEVTVKTLVLQESCCHGKLHIMQHGMHMNNPVVIKYVATLIELLENLLCMLYHTRQVNQII